MMSPEFIRLSSWLELGSFTFDPVPAVCSGITPAVDVAIPIIPLPALETAPKEEELEDEIELGFSDKLEDELLLAVYKLTIAALVGRDVTAPVELKLKV